MKDNLAITFVLPVLNETDSFRQTVETIVRLAGDHTHELLVVIADRTEPECLQLIEELQNECSHTIRVHKQTLPRLGGAMREAFEVANGSHIMLMATDLETDPELIPTFIETMQQQNCDIVAASRWLGGGGFDGYGRMKQLLNFLFQKFFGLLYWTRMTDLTYAYRLYRREVLQGIAWEEMGHPLLLECLLKPLRLGARIIEIPCTWRIRTQGTSANSFWQMTTYVRIGIRTRLMSKQRLRPSPDEPLATTAQNQ